MYASGLRVAWHLAYFCVAVSVTLTVDTGQVKLPSGMGPKDSVTASPARGCTKLLQVLRLPPASLALSMNDCEAGLLLIVQLTHPPADARMVPGTLGWPTATLYPGVMVTV